MKDSNDISTIDIETQVKRNRGRPVTGSAQSSAERQRAYRQRLKTQDVSVLNVKLADTDLFALERLSRHSHLSLSDMVSKLIKDKEASIVADLAYTSSEYEAYYRLDDDLTSYLK